MTKIRNAIQETFSRLAGFWSEWVGRSRAQTYEGARVEMGGGAPWREVHKSTDAWFIIDYEQPGGNRGPDADTQYLLDSISNLLSRPRVAESTW